MDAKKADILLSYADIENAKINLGFQPLINLEEGIRKCL